MRDLSTSTTTALAAEATGTAWLLATTITHEGSVVGNYINNTEDLAVDGTTYTASNLTLEAHTEDLRGGLPNATLRLQYVDYDLRDTLLGNKGLSGATVTVTPAQGDGTSAGFSWRYTVRDVLVDEQYINFTLGVQDPLSKRFPRYSYVTPSCRWKFGDGFCQASTSGLITGDCEFVSPDAGRNYLTVGTNQAYVRFSAGMLINVAGSSSNDGTYVIDTVTRRDYGVVILLTSDYRLVAEAAGATVILSRACDYTLTRCRAYNNLVNFGGSPGISGGIYG